MPLITKEAIAAALSAHAQWKKRLQDAIATGKSEFTPSVVTKDNACQFGQWLYSLSPPDTLSVDFQKVKALHANFHKVAADILTLALTGKKSEALEMLEHGGAYVQATGKLVLALGAWQNTIRD